MFCDVWKLAEQSRNHLGSQKNHLKKFEKIRKIDPGITPIVTHVNTHFTDFDGLIMFADAVLICFFKTSLEPEDFIINFTELKIESQNFP